MSGAIFLLNLPYIYIYIYISSNVCGYRGMVAAPRGNFPGEFLRPSVATWRIARVLVAPSGGYTIHQWRRLVDKSQLKLHKFVRLII